MALAAAAALGLQSSSVSYGITGANLLNRAVEGPSETDSISQSPPSRLASPPRAAASSPRRLPVVPSSRCRLLVPPPPRRALLAPLPPRPVASLPRRLLTPPAIASSRRRPSSLRFPEPRHPWSKPAAQRRSPHRAAPRHPVHVTAWSPEELPHGRTPRLATFFDEIQTRRPPLHSSSVRQLCSVHPRPDLFSRANQLVAACFLSRLLLLRLSVDLHLLLPICYCLWLRLLPRSRCKTFDKHCSIINGILATSGFGWDWNKNKLSIDSDSSWEAYFENHKEAAPYRHKVVLYWDSISLVYGKDHATGVAAKTAAESSRDMSKELSKEGSDSKEPSSATSTGLKRQRSGDSFTSMMAEKLDKFAEALKDDAPKPPTSKEILNTLNEVEGLEEDALLDLFDILTADARKYESLLALPVMMRRRWLLKQLNK